MAQVLFSEEFPVPKQEIAWYDPETFWGMFVKVRDNDLSKVFTSAQQYALTRMFLEITNQGEP